MRCQDISRDLRFVADRSRMIVAYVRRHSVSDLAGIRAGFQLAHVRLCIYIIDILGLMTL